mgnify:CR=1 FL=1
MLSKLKKLLPGFIGYIGIDIIIKNSNILSIYKNKWKKFTKNLIVLLALE